jgi:hypothetical protein
MKFTLLALTLASASLFAAQTKPAEVLADSPNPQRYLYGVTRNPGSVRLLLDIDSTGKLRHVKVLKGTPDLVPSAVRMAHDYKFAAAQVDGKNVPAQLELDLHFRFSQD